MAAKDCGCDCSEVYEALAELVYERVTETRRLQLIAHIEQCPGCLAQMGIEREVQALIQRCCCEQAPPRLREKIVIQLRLERG